MSEWFGAHLRLSAVEAPDKVALVFEDRSWTYPQLVLAVTRVAEQLRDLGVIKGDRVIVQGLPRPEALILPYAVAQLGAVLVLAHPQVTVTELGIMVEECSPRIVITAAGRSAAVVAEHLIGLEEIDFDDDMGRPDLGSASLEPPDGDDVAVIAYTSGTSGRPKGVLLTHDNLLWSMRNGLARLPVTEQDVTLVATPLAHVAVLAGLPQYTLAMRGTVVLAPRFEPDLFIDLVRRHAVTSAFVVPAMLALLVRNRRFGSSDLNSLRWLLAGGAPAEEATTLRFHDRGISVINSYGLSEASAGVTYAAADEVTRYPTSAGRPVPHVELRIADEVGTPLPIDEVGEIWLRGPSIASSYLTQVGVQAATDADGWLHTGDRGRLDAGGRLEVVGRVKDTIVTGGENVDPIEVEHALGDVPGIAELAVAGTADEIWGEIVTAFVVPGAVEPSLDDLRDRLDGKLAKHKWPRRLVITNALPRTATGKVQRQRLAELVEPRATGRPQSELA